MNIHQQGQVIDLGVNIDHVATLRNAAAGSHPDPVQAALLAEEAGADCIILHLREDRRHIRDEDVLQLRSRLMTRMNLNIAASSEMLDFACRIKPQDVCLLPELPEISATGMAEGGLDVVQNFVQVQAAVRQLQQAGMRVSVRIEASEQQIQASAEAGASVIVLHAGSYARAQDTVAVASELKNIKAAAITGIRHGLQVNAGHGLDYSNTAALAAIPEISALHIGHAIAAQALFVGWQKAVSDMKALMIRARLQTRV